MWFVSVYETSQPSKCISNGVISHPGIDQPIGAGFAQGTPSATSTEELAPQFMGFWKNFIDTFNMTGSKVYFAGESYAGVSC